MIASTSALASAATGLVGTMASSRSVRLSASVETGTASAPPRSTPAPGWNSRPKMMPIQTAKKVVAR
jgi:hypothetical protein